MTLLRELALCLALAAASVFAGVELQKSHALEVQIMKLAGDKASGDTALSICSQLLEQSKPDKSVAPGI